MKYEVKVTQRLKYQDTLVAKFDKYAEAMMFIEIVLKRCENVSVEIAFVDDKATEEEKKEG